VALTKINVFGFACFINTRCRTWSKMIALNFVNNFKTFRIRLQGS